MPVVQRRPLRGSLVPGMGPAPRPLPGSLSAQSHRAPSAAPPLLIRWKAGLLPQRRGTSAASVLWLVRGSLALSAFGAPVAAPRLLVRTTLRVSGRQLCLRCAALRELAGSRQMPSEVFEAVGQRPVWQ